MNMRRKQGYQSGWLRRMSICLFRGLLVAILSYPFLTFRAFAANSVAYRGLTPGVSTLEDTLRLLGKPVSKVFGDDRIVCKYRFIQVNIPKKTGKVQFILIYDPSFRDINGFRLGTSFKEIQEKLKVNGEGNTIVDLEKGIGYIFTSAGLVDQIVYGIVR